SITLEEAKNHFNKVVTRKNSLLVVVGDITVEDLKSKVAESLAKLPEGTAPKELYRGDKVSKGLYVEDRKIETNYVKGIFDAPKRGTEESVHDSLAFSILYDRFFEELRTKRSLSYAPSARATGYKARPMNEIYISTTDPKASIEVMIEELNKVKTEGFDQDELKGKK
ncbi:MAG: M16 family metallopeptidase, partial [Cryomorphaceae bacterium]